MSDSGHTLGEKDDNENEQKKYSAIGIRLFEILCTEITDAWVLVGPDMLRVGRLNLSVDRSKLTVSVRNVDEQTYVNLRLNDSLTRHDHARLAPLILRMLERLQDSRDVGVISAGVANVKLGKAVDPANMKFTDNGRALINALQKAINDDSVSVTQLLATIDGIREDLES